MSCSRGYDAEKLPGKTAAARSESLGAEMQDWNSFLASVVKKASVAAAQSGAAAAVGGGPQGAAAGAAAGAVVDSIMTELLGDFVQEQAEQFARLEKLNREMNGRLLALQKGVQTLLDGPLLEARLLLQQAAADHTPERRDHDILGARDALFRAFSLAQTDGRRALIAEQLAIVFVLDKDSDRGRDWISQAHRYASNAVRTQGQDIENRIRALYKKIDEVLETKEGKHYFAGGDPQEDAERSAFLDYRKFPEGLVLIRELIALIGFTGYCNSLRRSCQALGADVREAPELTIYVQPIYYKSDVPYEVKVVDPSAAKDLTPSTWEPTSNYLRLFGIDGLR
jgi:hypothetical protein